jgi:RHS repeat-associated protein
VGGVTTNYLYDGVDVVQEQIGGSPSANYLLGLGIDERFTRTDGTGTVAYLTDALGSTVALTDGAGAVATAYTYEPYGSTTQGGVGSANPARYTGREEDGTGLYYYRARYYNPRQQHFESEDPLGNVAGWNRFAYVHDAPTWLTDPLGLKPRPGFGPGPGGLTNPAGPGNGPGAGPGTGPGPGPGPGPKPPSPDDPEQPPCGPVPPLTKALFGAEAIADSVVITNTGAVVFIVSVTAGVGAVAAGPVGWAAIAVGVVPAAAGGTAMMVAGGAYANHGGAELADAWQEYRRGCR